MTTLTSRRSKIIEMEKLRIVWINEKLLAGVISKRIICEKAKQPHSALTLCIFCFTLSVWVLFRVLDLINLLCIISNGDN